MRFAEPGQKHSKPIELTFWIMILNNDNSSPAFFGIFDDATFIDRFYGEKIHNSYLNICKEISPSNKSKS